MFSPQAELIEAQHPHGPKLINLGIVSENQTGSTWPRHELGLVSEESSRFSSTTPLAILQRDNLGFDRDKSELNEDPEYLPLSNLL